MKDHNHQLLNKQITDLYPENSTCQGTLVKRFAILLIISFIGIGAHYLLSTSVENEELFAGATFTIGIITAVCVVSNFYLFKYSWFYLGCLTVSLTLLSYGGYTSIFNVETDFLDSLFGTLIPTVILITHWPLRTIFKSINHREINHYDKGYAGALFLSSIIISGIVFFLFGEGIIIALQDRFFTW